MSKEEFLKKVTKRLYDIEIELQENQIYKLYKEMKLLLEWNNKMNLTAITDEEEIINKHFLDSLTLIKYINEKDKVIDVGTGAGFPGIPIKIAKEKARVTLLDSLNKRIVFLQKTIDDLGLKDINTIHGRAEDIGRMKEHREKYDVAVARAVAPLNVLLEYLVPFIKVGGVCICMKAEKAEEEIQISQKAINELGVKIKEVSSIVLPDTDIKRKIIIVKKEKGTSKRFPRKAGTPSRNPL